MDGAHVHGAEPAEDRLAEPLGGALLDARLQRFGGLLGEREGDDRLRRRPREQVDDALGDDLGLAGAGRRDDLQVRAAVLDRGARVAAQPWRRAIHRNPSRLHLEDDPDFAAPSVDDLVAPCVLRHDSPQPLLHDLYQASTGSSTPIRMGSSRPNDAMP